MADLEQAKTILREMLQNRGADKTICPSEAARALASADWREIMPLVREAAQLLLSEGILRIEQKGVPVDPTLVRGPVRYRLLTTDATSNTEPAYLGGPKFLHDEIEKAKELKRLGLRWMPRPGHYVWDDEGLIEKSSPFQPQVYFILDLKHFLRRAGSIERLQDLLVWLPTWEDIRLILGGLGLTDEMIAQHLEQTRAVEAGNERTIMYDLALARLRTRVSG
jgi:hypothetical protein